MQHVKLQMGCMLVVLYIIVTYRKAMSKNNIKHHGLFDALIITAPLAIFFDGFTAWTVNHMDIVPEYINRPAHLLFFIFNDITIIITAEYMYQQLVGFRQGRKGKVLLGIPGMFALLLTTAGIGELRFLEGTTTMYSMGFSVYVSFAALVVYYGIILYIVITKRRFLSRDKILGTLSFIIIAGAVLIIQICFPESLISSLFPMMMLLGIYIIFENPFIQEVTKLKDEMLDGFATMVESRDNNTGGHIKRTKAYVQLILNHMRHDKYYEKIITKDYQENVINAAPLHDIGKISTPDRILQKPGKLTDEEYQIMQEHAAAGAEIVLQTFKDLDDEEFKQIAYDVARHHHEKYNGKGYPDGLSGEEIPLHARIMAIADVFDAISQRRCYRDAMPLDECFAIIENGKGTDFDPRLVQIFLDARDEVAELVH